MAQLFGGVGAETPWEWARKQRHLFADPIKETVTGVVSAVLTAYLSYKAGVQDWKQAGLIGVAGGVVMGLGPSAIETIIWRLRYRRIIAEEANEDLRQEISELREALATRTLQSAQPGPPTPNRALLPEHRPKVALVRYGKGEEARSFDGFIFLNEGETAYDLSVPNLHVGDAEVVIAGDANILKKGDELFCEQFVKEGHDGTVNSLFSFMRERDIDELPVSIHYRDFEGNWYRTDSALQRNVMMSGGLGIGPFTQHQTSGPPNIIEEKVNAAQVQRT